MRVALVQSSWTPHSEARLRVAGDHLAAEGVALDVITAAASQSDYQWPAPAAESRAVFPDKDYWRLGYRELRARLIPALESSNPDVVVLPGWNFRESLAGLGWAIRTSIPKVLVSDSQGIDHQRHFFKEKAKRLLVRNFDSALVGGSRSIDYLADLGFERFACWPGCDVVDNAFFGAAPASTAGEEPVLLSCIRLLARKNVPALLDVLARTEGWRWRIAGDGPDRQTIERRIAELGLRDRVELLGHVPYQDLPKLYASAHVYLQPSLSEPWGMAVNEAMAAGRPVLVSDRCGCSPDLVEEGSNGFRFDPADPRSIKNALIGMLRVRDRWPEMGTTSERIISGWGLDLYAASLLRASKKAMATRRRSSLVDRALGRSL